MEIGPDAFRWSALPQKESSSSSSSSSSPSSVQIFIFFLSVFFILQNLAWHLFNFRVNDNAFFICDNLTTSQFDNFRYVKATNWASHSSEIEPVPVNPSFKFFSVSLKFRACYITGQWGEFTVKNASLYWDILSWGSFYCFHQKIVFIIFVSFFDEVSNFCNITLTNQKLE